MRNFAKFSGMLILTVFYCLAISLVSNSSVIFDNNSQKQSYFSSVSIDLFCNGPQTESSLRNLNNFPSPSFKNPFDRYTAAIKTADQLFKTEFGQYIKILRKTPVKSRKADLIFPFHYFW